MVKLFATIQKSRPEVQLLSLAAAFVIMSETLRFNTNDAYASVVNLMKDPVNATGRGHQFDAMKWHLETELLGKPE